MGILVSMPFIHHNVFEVCQDPGELGMHRQDAPMQHVWVGDQQLRSITCFPTVGLQGTARCSHIKARPKAMRGRKGEEGEED